MTMHEIVQSESGGPLPFLSFFSTTIETATRNATSKTNGGHAKPEISNHLRELEGLLSSRETHVSLQSVRIKQDEIIGSTKGCC